MLYFLFILSSLSLSLSVRYDSLSQHAEQIFPSNINPASNQIHWNPQIRAVRARRRVSLSMPNSLSSRSRLKIITLCSGHVTREVNSVIFMTLTHRRCKDLTQKGKKKKKILHLKRVMELINKTWWMELWESAPMRFLPQENECCHRGFHISA